MKSYLRESGDRLPLMTGRLVGAAVCVVAAVLTVGVVVSREQPDSHANTVRQSRIALSARALERRSQVVQRLAEDDGNSDLNWTKAQLPPPGLISWPQPAVSATASQGPTAVDRREDKEVHVLPLRALSHAAWFQTARRAGLAAAQLRATNSRFHSCRIGCTPSSRPWRKT